MARYLENYIYQDLTKKMVFLGGPRQVGKTTLSKSLISQKFSSGAYFNWDINADRNALQNHEWLDSNDLLVFDELHKMPKWKQWIKGVYDSKPQKQQYMVTGSARLDVYQRGGDSLLGRYHYWRLHPFTLDEHPSNISTTDAYNRLLTLGGFPEPFLSNDAREARRWRQERFTRILREDIRDLEFIRDIQLLSLFTDLLRDRVGGLITLSNMARDLEISPKTAKKWLELLERMYIGFAIKPYSQNITRAIRKPPKFYFYDNADATNGDAARLENLVASHLLKRLNFIEDYEGYPCSLHYIRDKDGREVDFLTVVNGQPIDLIEVKTKETTISSALKYYSEKLKPKHTTQIVGTLKRSFNQSGILVTSPVDFFKEPPWHS